MPGGGGKRGLLFRPDKRRDFFSFPTQNFSSRTQRKTKIRTQFQKWTCGKHWPLRRTRRRDPLHRFPGGRSFPPARTGPWLRPLDPRPHAAATAAVAAAFVEEWSLRILAFASQPSLRGPPEAKAASRTTLSPPPFTTMWSRIPSVEPCPQRDTPAPAASIVSARSLWRPRLSRPPRKTDQERRRTARRRRPVRREEPSLGFPLVQVPRSPSDFFSCGCGKTFGRTPRRLRREGAPVKTIQTTSRSFSFSNRKKKHGRLLTPPL